MTRLPTRYHVLTTLGTDLVAKVRAVYREDHTKTGFAVAYDIVRHLAGNPDKAQQWFRAIGCPFVRKPSAHTGTSKLYGIHNEDYWRKKAKAEAARLAATTQGKEGE